MHYATPSPVFRDIQSCLASIHLCFTRHPYFSFDRGINLSNTHETDVTRILRAILSTMLLQKLYVVRSPAYVISYAGQIDKIYHHLPK